jgi:hypothetical protein
MVESRGTINVNMPTPVETYQITPDAYGTRRRRALGWVLDFLVFAGLLFLGFIFIDLLLRKHSKGALSSRPDFLKNILEPVFVAGVATLLRMMSYSVRKTLEVRPDSITVYDEGPTDPLYRRGTTIPRSEITEIQEMRLFSLFGPKTYGLMVKYGPKRWKGKRVFMPSRIRGYTELSTTPHLGFRSTLRGLMRICHCPLHRQQLFQNLAQLG